MRQNFEDFYYLILSRPASQNMRKRSRDESRRRIYARKIPYIYTLSLK